MSKKHKTMGSRKGKKIGTVPRYWGKSVGMNNERQKKTETKDPKRIAENRAAVGQVMEYCATIAAADVLDLSNDALDQLMAETNRQTARYALLRDRRGWMTARRELEAVTNPLFTQSYTVKAGQKPSDSMSNKTWRMLFAQQRAAADLVLRFNARALNVLHYSREQVNDVMAEAVSNYAQFLEWAEDGEEVAYEKLRRIVEQLFEEPTYVERVGNPEPIFAKEF